LRPTALRRRAGRPQLKRDPLGSRNQGISCQPSSSGCSSSTSASPSALVFTSTASLCPDGSAHPLPKVSNGTLLRRVRTTRGEGSGALLQRVPSRFSRWQVWSWLGAVQELFVAGGWPPA